MSDFYYVNSIYSDTSGRISIVEAASRPRVLVYKGVAITALEMTAFGCTKK